MPSITQEIVGEITRIARMGFQDVRLRTLEDQRTVLTRRLQSRYDKLSIEQIKVIQQALGHTDTEDKPCKACRIVAQKEFDLAED